MNISLNMPNPDNDGYFYLYHYTKAEFLYDILTNRRLKVTMMGHSNDPLENLPSFKCDDSDSREDILSVAKFKNLWQGISRDRHQAIVCLSSKCSSMLMWGHYAQGHNGACLVFRFKVFPSVKSMMIPIEYSEKMIQVKDYFLSGCNNKIVNLGRLTIDLASRKPLEWEYEREFRLSILDKKSLEYENGSYYTHILSDYLYGVILGANCPLTIDEVSSMSKKTRSHQNTDESSQESDLIISRASFSEDNYLIGTFPYSDLSDTSYKRLVLLFQENVNNPEIEWTCFDLTTNSFFQTKINASNAHANYLSNFEFPTVNRNSFTIMNIPCRGNISLNIDSTLGTR